jgi:hypothetical protein
MPRRLQHVQQPRPRARRLRRLPLLLWRRRRRALVQHVQQPLGRGIGRGALRRRRRLLHLLHLLLVAASLQPLQEC